MFFTLSIILGIGMFIHYGCQILKHDVAESTFFMKFALIVTFISIVLILRAAVLKDFEQIAYGFFLFALAQSPLSVYLWFYGMTYKRASRTASETQIDSVVNQIKRQL